MITESVFFIEYRLHPDGIWYRMQCMGPWFDPITPAELCGRLAEGVNHAEYRVSQYRRVDAQG